MAGLKVTSRRAVVVNNCSKSSQFVLVLALLSSLIGGVSSSSSARTPSLRDVFDRQLIADVTLVISAPQMSPISKSLIPTLNYSLTPEEIISGATRAIDETNAFFGKLLAIPDEQRTAESVLIPWAESEGRFRTAVNSFIFPQYVSGSEAVRNASVEANKCLNQFGIECSMREDLYRLAVSVRDHNEPLEGEVARFLKKLLIEFRRNGLELSEEERAVLKEKRQRLAELAVDYSNTINADKTELLLTKDDLDGCPADFLESLGQRDGKYVVTMKYPDVSGVMKHAKQESTRRLLHETDGRKCKGNVARLEEACRIRDECAKLLGYADHMTFQLEQRMAKRPEDARSFLAELSHRLNPFAQKELARLDALKGAPLAAWDYNYYARVLEEKEYALDGELVSQYFPLEHVTREMLAIYEQVLSLRFRKVDIIGEAAPVWHPDVELFEVTDQSSNGSLVGYFYLDLHPRDGKYTHAACFGQQPGYLRLDGSRQIPVAAMVANFTKPTAGRLSLLKHDEVVVYFHELGHVMHSLCARTRIARFHGTNTEKDFVEAPSQMLENWCWQSNILSRLSRHHKTGESLPASLIDSLVLTKNLNAGLLNLRQIFFGVLDMTIHSHGFTGDINAFYEKLRLEITLIPQAQGIEPAASFGHLMGGYDAGYYGYLWSQVFSADMFYTCFQANVLSAKIGADYRRSILQPGGSRDGIDSLVEFLGRKPTQEPFLRSLGLVAEN